MSCKRDTNQKGTLGVEGIGPAHVNAFLIEELEQPNVVFAVDL